MSRSTRKRLSLVALALLVVLAGCSGAGGADSQAATAGDGGRAPATEAAKSGDASATGGRNSVSFQAQQRALIRTGSVRLTVSDFDASRANLTAAANARGGYVSDSTQRVHQYGNDTYTTGKLVYRVPKANFSAFVARVKAEGEVEQSNTHTKDVTDQLVDLEARLTNLRAQRERLRELYRNASDTENVLAVQKRLSEVQTEIERLEAQRKSLRKRVAYSTVTVELREQPPDHPTPERTQWYETGLIAAFTDSVRGVGVVLRGISVAAAYSAPYLLAFGVPLGGVVVAWRRFA